MFDEYAQQTWGPDDPLLFLVDDVFTVKSRGIAASGRALRGTPRRGADVHIFNFSDDPIAASLDGVNSSRLTQDEFGLFFKSQTADDISRYCLIVEPGSMKAQRHFRAKVYSNPNHRRSPFYTGYKPQFQVYGFYLACEVTVPDDGQVEAGELADVLMELIVPIPLEENMKFGLYEGAALAVEGIITELL